MGMRQFEWGGAAFDTEDEWREWVRNHPRRPFLRMVRMPPGRVELVIYDRVAYEADPSINKLPNYHKVAWTQIHEGARWFMVLPATAKPD